MKKYMKIMILVIFILQLVGCSNNEIEDKSIINSPSNNNLKISGKWDVENYEILDEDIYDRNSIKAIIDSGITIDNSNFRIGEKNYDNTRYKLKVVKPSYTISYEAKFKVENLDIKKEEIEVISIIYQNNILGEFIEVDDTHGYLYYQGILFDLVWKEKVTDNKNEDKESINEDIEKESISYSSQGLYLGLKTPAKTYEDGTYVRESYRTLWISTKNNQIQTIKEMNNIIFPRVKGIWKLEPEIIQNKEDQIYYEYFAAKPIDADTEFKVEKNIVPISPGINLHRSINFIGNDYIATEVVETYNSVTFNEFEVLPIDNLYINNGLLISDLYSKEIDKTYENIYEQNYRELSQIEKDKLSKYVSYNNFTLVRNNGKWVIEGRISAINNEKPYDFTTNIKPNKKLINYDTLVIPWKVLKGELPFLVDAFTSPDGSLAIIVMHDELLVYLIEDGTLTENPIKTIPLKEGEEIIMAEWCSSDYVDKWGAAFKENSKIIE